MRSEAAPQPGGLERFISAGKGRGLRARRRYAIGELLFSCPAYTAVLTVSERSSHCDGCFARKEGLSKCGRCKQAFYCNVECQTGENREEEEKKEFPEAEEESHTEPSDSGQAGSQTLAGRN